MKKNLMGKITKKAWEIRKYYAKKWNCKVMEIVWKDCIKLAIEAVEHEGEILSFDDWYTYYNNNIKTFNYILYHNNILQKNGKFTESQKLEAETTSAFYKILEGEEEDIKQETLLRMMKYAKKNNGIPYKYRFSAYALCALNAIKAHNRMVKRSRLAVNPNIPLNTGYGDNSEKILIIEDSTTFSDLRIDMQRTLTDRQIQVCQLLEAGYNLTETAKIMKTSRVSLNRWKEKIRNTLKNDILKVQYK
jgi:DNA-directed RNA polymerase specialized sigma24 family protein